MSTAAGVGLRFGLQIPAASVRSVRGNKDYPEARSLAVLAERNGLDYVFVPPVGTGPGAERRIGPRARHELTAPALTLLGAVRRTRIVAGVNAADWHPVALARFAALADRLSGGRFGIEVVSAGPGPLHAGSPAPVAPGPRRTDVAGPETFVRRGPEPLAPGGNTAARTADWILHEGLHPDTATIADRPARSAVRLDLTLPADVDAPTLAAELVGHRRWGIGLIVLVLDDPATELPRFGREVLPWVRELEEARLDGAVPMSIPASWRSVAGLLAEPFPVPVTVRA